MRWNPRGLASGRNYQSSWPSTMFAVFFVLVVFLETGLHAMPVAGKHTRPFQFPRGLSSGTVVPKGASGFGVVLDAGSSGTRVHVYVWKEAHEYEARGKEKEEDIALMQVAEKEEDGVRPLLREVRIPGPGPVGFAWNKQHKPPISSLEHEPELAGKALQPLLEHAKSIILAQPGVRVEDEEAVLSCVPVILGATGGMRMLSPEAAETIMESARKVLRSSSFLFKDEWARIISGEEEVS